jgi:threonine aldolase
MRQAGILAAAGLYALEHHRADLAHDHAKAHRLAEGIAQVGSFTLDPSTVETNIVLFDVEDTTAEAVVDTLADDGVLLTPFGPQTVRATTHRDVSMDEIEQALDTIQARFGTATTAV